MLRILLMLGLAAAAGAAGWQVWQLEHVRAAQRHDTARLDTIAFRATRAVLDIRASQRAYLSPGQGIAFWKPRVDQSLLTLRDDLDALKNSTLSASSPAVVADDAALDALGEVSRLERRIAEHVEAGRLEHAADLVYADNIRASLALEQAVDSALTAHRIELQAQQTDMRWREGGILALTVLAGLLLAFVLLPSRTRASRQAEGVDQTVAAAEEGILALRPSAANGDPRSPGLVPTRSAAATAAAGTAAAARGPAVTTGAARPDLAAKTTARPGSARATETGSVGTAAARTSTSVGKQGSTGGGTAAAGARNPSAAVVAARLDLAATATASAARSELATGAAIARAAADAASVGATARPSTASAGASQGTSSAATAVRETPAATTVSSPVGASTATGPSILAAADLCVSMACVSDAAGLQPLLARVADQLDAVGVIVWLQDVDGRTLEPALTHGYAADTLTHLRALDWEADNATARAFRTGQPQTVAGRGAEPGALVVPMQTAAGCVGVIAAELRHGREHDPATLALARIVAAQLAMLTASPAGSE